MILGWEPPSASPGNWQKCQPDMQKPEKDSKTDSEGQQSQQTVSTLPKEAIGPFIRHNINIFQVWRVAIDCERTVAESCMKNEVENVHITLY